MNQPPDQVRRTAETARRLKVNPATLRRWAREGKITSVALGRHMGFLDSDVDDFIRRNRSGAA
jgi:excisionase family DNA binding protein